MKNIKRNSIILLLVTIIVLYIILKDNFLSIISILKNINILFIFLAFILYFIHLFLRSLANHLFITDKEKVSLKETFKHTLITQFFNGITPFSSGGQPMEIYMLTKHNIRVTKATNIIMQNFIAYQLALVLVGLLACLTNYKLNIITTDSLLKQLILLGFTINTLVALALLVITFSKKVTTKVANFIIIIEKKFSIYKHKDNLAIKWEERLTDFHNYTKELKDKKMIFTVGILINILSLLTLYSIPFLITLSIGNLKSITLIDSIVMSAYVLIIGSFVPIPGASGGIEYGFIRIFANHLNTKNLNAILLIWRFITYYFGMIIGSIVFNIHQGGEKCE